MSRRKVEDFSRVAELLTGEEETVHGDSGYLGAEKRPEAIIRNKAGNVDNFIKKAKSYTAIDELTPKLLRLFIQRIEVEKRTKKHAKTAGQSIRIVYRDIEAIDSIMQEGEVRPYIKPPVILTGEITVGGVPVPA